MKKALLGLMLLGGSLFATPRIGIGINVGVPAPAARVAFVRPPCPGPGYAWVDGYYASNGAWIAGYWAPPAPVRRAYVAPRYVAPRNEYRAHVDRRDDFRRDRNDFRR